MPPDPLGATPASPASPASDDVGAASSPPASGPPPLAVLLRGMFAQGDGTYLVTVRTDEDGDLTIASSRIIDEHGTSVDPGVTVLPRPGWAEPPRQH